METFFGLAEKVTAVDQERRLKKGLKGLALLKTICDNGKVFDLSYVTTLEIQLIMAPSKVLNLIMLRGRKLQLIIMSLDRSTKLLHAAKAVSKMIHMKIAAYKVLKSWIVMEDTSKKSTTGPGCNMVYDEENSDNGNDQQSDDDDTMTSKLMMSSVAIVIITNRMT